MADIQYRFEGEIYDLTVDDSVLRLPQNEMNATIEDSILQYQASKGRDVGSSVGEALSDVARPFSRVPEIYSQEVEVGQELMSKGVGQMFSGDEIFRGAGNFALGGLKYLYSPVEASVRGIAGEPVGATAEDVALGLGAEQGTAESIGQFAEDFATLAPQVFTPGSLLKAAQTATKPTVRLDKLDELGDAQLGATGREFEGLAGYLTGTRSQVPVKPVQKPFEDKPVLQGSENIDKLDDPSVIRPDPSREIPIDVDSKGTVERLSLATSNEVVTDPGLIQRIQNARKRFPDDKQRLFRKVGDALRVDVLNGDLPVESLPRIMKDLGFENPNDVAKIFEVSASEAGKTLGQLSMLQRKLAQGKHVPKELKQKLLTNADELAKGNPGSISKALEYWRKIENFRRATLVSQLGTAVRNSISSVGRLGLSTIDDMVQAGLGGRGTGTLKDVWDSLSADFNALPVVRGATGYKSLVNEVLEGNPVAKEKLYGRTIQEVDSIGKVAKTLNTFNILQEKFFRNMAFQARLEKDLKSYGVSMKDIVNGKIRTKDGNLIDIPGKILDDAISHSLDMTFASNGGPLAKTLVQGFEKIPFLYTINPFPRFTFANVLPFLRDHSPYGFAKAFSPKTLAKLAKGDSKDFAESMSRAMLGTAMFGTAMEIRNSDMAGEKWYEVVVDGKTYDARPFAPFSFYLLAAEYMNPNNNLRSIDFADVAAGINRISGTGLVLVDLLRSKGEVSGEKIAEYFGNYLSGLTVPIKQVKDLFAMDETIRDSKADTWAGKLVAPTYRNLPFASEELAPARSPLREEALKREPGFFGLSGGQSSQIFGLTGKTKNLLEKEVDKLGLDYSAYTPRTGVAEANNYLSAIIGRKANAYIPAMIERDIPILSLFPKFQKLEGLGFDVNKPYSKLSKAGKKLALKEIFKLIKKEARDQLKIRNPSLQQKVDIEGLSADEEEYYSEELGL
jgi:hypothetical protein